MDETSAHLVVRGARAIELSALTFDREFSRFCDHVEQRSGTRFVSFREGLPAEWEGYKAAVHTEAVRLLGSPRWKAADVGKGRILSRVIRAIELPANNLVLWHSRYGPARRHHLALIEAQGSVSARRDLEQWFFDFFLERTKDADAFTQFLRLAGRNFDLVAYIFFLKDWNHFAPIKPGTFEKAFRLLGFDVRLSKSCSWETYERYNNTLRTVQGALHDFVGLPEPPLIDAHSFCWMLARLQPTAAPVVTVTIPLPETITGLSRLPERPSASAAESSSQRVTDEQFAQRQEAQRRIGQLAQEIALKCERRRLREAGHPNPDDAAVAVWDKPGLGYDILSSEIDGTARHIEVKAARKSEQGLSFFVSSNEWRKSRSLPNYRFYFVLDATSDSPTVLDADAMDVPDACLQPVTYFASGAMPRNGRSPTTRHPIRTDGDN